MVERTYALYRDDAQVQIAQDPKEVPWLVSIPTSVLDHFEHDHPMLKEIPAVIKHYVHQD